MKADHAAQLRLLDLQAADTALAQLRHRRTHLPELAMLAECDATAQTLGHEVVEAETAAGDAARAQRKLEDEVDAVRARAARDEQRLQAGGLPAKELERIQHEIGSLARRQATLEDELLELMEAREEADTRLAGLRTQVADLDTQRAELTSTRDAAFTEIDAAIDERNAARGALAADLPADLLSAYDRAQAHSGAGAALLRARRCEGCHLELSGADLSAVRSAADDDVVRCDNCRAVLVRTAESGL